MQGFHIDEDDMFVTLYTISRRACLDNFRETQRFKLDPSGRMFHMKMYHEIRKSGMFSSRFRVMREGGMFYIVSVEPKETKKRCEQIVDHLQIAALEHTELYKDVINIISEYVSGEFSVQDFTPKFLYAMPLSGSLQKRDINDWIAFVEKYSFFYRTASLYTHLKLDGKLERPELTKEWWKFCANHVITFDYRKRPVIFAFPQRDTIMLQDVPLEVLYNMKVKDIEDHYIYNPNDTKKRGRESEIVASVKELLKL